jgi:YD repeat-containing protein
VYDAQGRTLAATTARVLGPGTHTFTWDGHDRSGRSAGAGVFWLKLSVDGATETRRIVRLR